LRSSKPPGTINAKTDTGQLGLRTVPRTAHGGFNELVSFMGRLSNGDIICY
jgi:hypothetical protein